MTERDRYRDDIKAYLDNELPLPRRFAMRRHIATCAACREELLQMTQITEQLSAEAALEPAPNIDAALRGKILGEYREPNPGLPNLKTADPKWRRKQRLIEVITAVCAIAFVVVGTMRFGGQSAGNKLNAVAGNVSNGDGGP